MNVLDLVIIIVVFGFVVDLISVPLFADSCMVKAIVEKIACKHSYEKIGQFEDSEKTVMVFKCSKCGKIKKIRGKGTFYDAGQL